VIIILTFFCVFLVSIPTSGA